MGKGEITAMLSDLTIKKLLRETKLMKAAESKAAETKAEEKKLPIEKVLLEDKLISEDQLYREAALILKMPFTDLSAQIIRKDILYIVPEPIATTHHVVAFEKDEKTIKLATTEPDDIQIFEFIGRRAGTKTEIFLTTPRLLAEAMKQYRVSLKAEFAAITQGEDKPDEQEKLKKLAEDLPVVRIVDSLLEHAIFERASDIHVEPSEKEIAVRYRVDGILRNVMTLPAIAQPGIVARIKILSNLKLDEHRLPQDGRFKIAAQNNKFSVRVSILPVIDGEKIVMRLLNEGAEAYTLEQLGFEPSQLEILKRNIKKPHGIVMVTGPTGSGKTTTLYSILGVLNSPKINISTVEDPIEYRMLGVNQSQVNTRIGFTFAAGLRALLRQDPNIIMVGEIRDMETADIAIHAALTGHLVLSTLHTNDAATSLPRLIDMGVPAFLIAFTANLIVAQRLTRKLCPECREKYKLTKGDLEELKKQMDLELVAKKLRDLKILKTNQGLDDVDFYRPKGCSKCNEGYKGRSGIYEALEVTKPIVELIHKRADASELQKEAVRQGMLTVLEHGFIKAIQGTTSLEEILRVTQE